MTYSFDIFDTCLVRRCGHPSVVFELLASRILGKDEEESVILDFAYIRRRGEELALLASKNTTHEEISLDDIYRQCDFSSLTHIDNAIIKNTELEIEKEVLCPVHSVKEHITKLRAEGNKILFISDMYLPQYFIAEILLEHGFLTSLDHLYVSSEYNKRKSTGHLYEHVKNTENLNFRQWIHEGDNILSDVEIPRKLGIKAILTNHAHSYYERLLGSNAFSGLSTLQICSALSRSIRLSEKSSPERDFAADLIAPIYVSFVAWMMDDAKKRGLQRLYFFARDGYIFYHIAQTFTSQYPEIELHYIYVSRKSLYLPGLYNISPKSIEKYVLGKSLINVLDCFQMEDLHEDFAKYDKLSGYELIEALLLDNDFTHALKERHENQKELLLQYLIQEDLHKGSAAIVDLNGSRNGQTIISKIITDAGYPSVFGYFFVLSNTRKVGKDYKNLFFYEQLANNSRLQCSMPPVMMLEEYFSLADHPTTIKYMKKGNEQIVPVFGEDTIDKKTKGRIFEANFKVCQEYAVFYQKYIPTRLASQICYSALSVITDFYFSPIYKYLKVFENLTFSWTSVLRTQILRKGNILSLILNRQNSSWFFGEFVYRFPFHNLATIILRLIYSIRKNILKIK